MGGRQPRSRVREASRESDVELGSEDDGESWRVREEACGHMGLPVAGPVGQRDLGPGHARAAAETGETRGETEADTQRRALPGHGYESDLLPRTARSRRTHGREGHRGTICALGSISWRRRGLTETQRDYSGGPTVAQEDGGSEMQQRG